MVAIPCVLAFAVLGKPEEWEEMESDECKHYEDVRVLTPARIWDLLASSVDRVLPTDCLISFIKLAAV